MPASYEMPKKRKRGPVNEFAGAKSDLLKKMMLRASVSQAALQRRSQLPMQTIEKALRGADMSNSIYDGLIRNVEEIENGNPR